MASRISKSEPDYTNFYKMRVFLYSPFSILRLVAGRGHILLSPGNA